MKQTEIIEYLFYGYSLLISLIALVSGNALFKPRFYHFLFRASLISVFIGVLLEILNYFSNSTGFTLVMMSIPFIQLAEFELFRKLFVKRYSMNPIVTSRQSKVGTKEVLPELFTDSNRDRQIMPADFVFTFAHVMVPIFTIMILLLLTKK